jgi:transposase
VVHVLRDSLKELWRHPGRIGIALRGGIAPLRHFALTCRASLVHCRYPLGTELVEGINYKVKVKRTAYGFRDDAYLFLKSRAAFPGVGR